MAPDVCLTDSGRYFEIRFESIGELAAHAAGQIVASAATLYAVSTMQGYYANYRMLQNEGLEAFTC